MNYLNEWTAVAAIAVLVNLFLAVYNPMSKSTKDNTRAMTELTVTLRQLVMDFNEFKDDNKSSHQRMHKRNDAQDVKIGEHETKLYNHENRIQILERKEGLKNEDF